MPQSVVAMVVFVVLVVTDRRHRTARHAWQQRPPGQPASHNLSSIKIATGNMHCFKGWVQRVKREAWATAAGAPLAESGPCIVPERSARSQSLE